MVKINEIKLQPYSIRGLAISFPVVFARDNNMSAGDFVKVYREKRNGVDVLVLSKNELPENTISVTPNSFANITD